MCHFQHLQNEMVHLSDLWKNLDKVHKNQTDKWANAPATPRETTVLRQIDDNAIRHPPSFHNVEMVATQGT